MICTGSHWVVCCCTLAASRGQKAVDIPVECEVFNTGVRFGLEFYAASDDRRSRIFKSFYLLVKIQQFQTIVQIFSIKLLNNLWRMSKKYAWRHGYCNRNFPSFAYFRTMQVQIKWDKSMSMLDMKVMYMSDIGPSGSNAAADTVSRKRFPMFLDNMIALSMKLLAVKEQWSCHSNGLKWFWCV
mgnify:CR=1 FL=1